MDGIVHTYVAFDWGEEVDLRRARELLPAEQTDLPRRRRTPSSIVYRPPPLRFHLPAIQITLPELGQVEAAVEATVYDFGAVSVSLQTHVQCTPEGMTKLAGSLAEPQNLVDIARAAIEPLFEKLLPAIQHPHKSELNEEYFVFQFAPGPELAPTMLLAECCGWLARLVRLESGPLSKQEIAEAVRLNLSYSPEDLFLADWSAAVLIDRDCEETLQTIELANVQLLEYRQIDDQLDQRLAEAYAVIHPLARTWLPFWRTQTKPLRMLGDLRISSTELFDRTGNVLKLVGDQYLARVHRMLAARFHLEQWEKSIRDSLDVTEGVYKILSDQAATYRTELLEIIIILLIAYEIVSAFWSS